MTRHAPHPAAPLATTDTSACPPMHITWSRTVSRFNASAGDFHGVETLHCIIDPTDVHHASIHVSLQRGQDRRTIVEFPDVAVETTMSVGWRHIALGDGQRPHVIVVLDDRGAMQFVTTPLLRQAGFRAGTYDRPVEQPRRARRDARSA